MNCPRRCGNGPCGGVRPLVIARSSRHALRLGLGLGRSEPYACLADAWPSVRCGRPSTGDYRTSAWLARRRLKGRGPAHDPSPTTGAARQSRSHPTGHFLRRASRAAVLRSALGPSPPNSRRRTRPDSETFITRAVLRRTVRRQQRDGRQRRANLPHVERRRLALLNGSSYLAVSCNLVSATGNRIAIQGDIHPRRAPRWASPRACPTATVVHGRRPTRRAQPRLCLDGISRFETAGSCATSGRSRAPR